jgi:hypothetical protein
MLRSRGREFLSAQARGRLIMMAVIIILQVLVFLTLLATLASEMVTRHEAFERWRRLPWRRLPARTDCAADD